MSEPRCTSPTRPGAPARPLLTCLGLLAALAACGHKRPPAPVVDDDAPVLPAMEAEVYARGTRPPSDPVVAAAAAGRPLDESLSGAAATMALDSASLGFSLPLAQWAAWRAGYPFAVILGAMATTSERAAPEAIRRVLDEHQGDGEDLGLARARVGVEDRWVALVGRPVDGVPAFARQYEEGDTLELALPPGGTWTLVSPEGVPTRGEGSIRRTLADFGEWWLEARLPDGALSVPLYVGMAMPPTPVLDLPGEPAAGPDDARDLAYDLLGQLREEFDLSPLRPDSLLETLARRPLDELVAGAWDHDGAVARLRAAGFVEGPADVLWCRSPTVAGCIDGLVRTASGRVALLDPRLSLVGVQARVESQGLLLLIDLASEQ